MASAPIGRLTVLGTVVAALTRRTALEFVLRVEFATLVVLEKERGTIIVMHSHPSYRML